MKPLIREFLIILFGITINLSTIAQAQEFDPFVDNPESFRAAQKQELNKYGEEPSTPEQAIEYYDYCMEKRNRYMCAEAQDDYCACAGIKIREEMSRNDMITYDKDLKTRDSATLLFVQRVAVPCMFHPIYDYTFSQCLKRPDLLRTHKPTIINICKCAGASMKDYTENKAGPYTAGLLATDFDGRSAYSRLFSSTKFHWQVRGAADRCARKIGN